MIRKFCDLDNTIIFSHRREIGDKVTVEYLNGKAQSFMPAEAYAELQRQGRNAIVPLTSRTKEQYGRIHMLKNGEPLKFALVDNGGILLIDGEEDTEWTRRTFDIVSKDFDAISEVENMFENTLKTKMQDGLILFIKAENEKYLSRIRQAAEEKGLMFFCYRNKAYVCSMELTKGNAIKRFIKRFPIGHIVVAGDSLVDCSMADIADKCILSKDLECVMGKKERIKFLQNEHIGFHLLELN